MARKISALARGLTRDRVERKDPDAELEWRPIRDVPRHFARTIAKGQDALAQYLELRRGNDLDKVQAVWDAVVADARFGGATRAFRADLLNRCSAARQWRAARDGSPLELDRALQSLNEALDIAPAASDRALYLHNAGMAYLLRFQLVGRESDLDAALRAMGEAVTSAGEDGRARALAHSGTAALLSTRFRLGGARRDIDDAVANARAAVSEAPPDSPRAGRYRGILSEALSYRFDAFGVIDDLQQAIALRMSDGEPDPDGRAALGSLLRRRWLALGDRRDLDRSIDLLQEAVDAGTPGSRPPRLTNLGNALLERYAEKGEITDVRRAVDAHELSVRTTVEGDWQLASRHNNAGNSALSLYGATGDGRDLDRAVRHYERALTMTPRTAQERASREYNLANGLRSVYDRSGAADDAAAATNAYRAACESGLLSGLEWALASGQAWATWAAERTAWADAGDASKYGIEAIDQLFRRQLDRDEKESWLARAAGLPPLAAYCLAAARRPAEAAVAFERGRAFLLSETLELDRTDLGRLRRAGRGNLAERYRVASEAVRTARDATTERSPALRWPSG